MVNTSRSSLQNYPKELLECLFGKLLGDGNILIQQGRASRFRFSHSAKDKEWVFHCYNELRKYIDLSEPVYSMIHDTRIQAGYTEQYYVQSRTNPLYNVLKEIWYKNKTKQLPLNILAEYLTPLCLAWWYQDDGHLKKKNYTPQRIILSTESFIREELRGLVKILEEKYKVSFTVDRQNRLVLYDQASILYFLSIIRPFLCKSMNRKDIYVKKYTINDFPISHRTSFYISSSLHFHSPTYEIKQLITSIQNYNFKIKNLYIFYFEQIKGKINIRKGYQIKLNNQELYQLKRLEELTGFTKGQCIEFLASCKNDYQ